MEALVTNPCNHSGVSTNKIPIQWKRTMAMYSKVKKKTKKTTEN